MLTDYIQAAMKRAKYEMMEDGEGFFATIPGFKGVWASDKTLEGVREELQSVLEDWILLKLHHSDRDFPVLGKREACVSRQEWERL